MSDSQIKCVALKINGDELLLPGASVAEIVPIRNIINVANKPGWMLGYLDWRGNSVPLISFEMLGGVRMPSLASGDVKAAVLYAIGGDKGFPFMSILVQSSPSVVILSEDDINSIDEEINNPAVEDKVKVSENDYSIVDLEKIEAIIKGVMTH